MRKKKQQDFFTHQYPPWLRKHPRWIHLIYTGNYLLQLRKWYITKTLGKRLRSKSQPFHLLDAGSGEGQFLLPYTSKYRQSYFKGIDRAKSNIAFGNSYAENRGFTHVRFEEIEIEALSEKEVYDMVLCISVLPYTVDDRAALQCLHHTMKPGAELLLYVPVNQTIILPFYKKLLLNYENYETIQQNQRIYTKQTLIKLLTDNGFIITEMKDTYGFFGKLSNELLNSHLILFNAYSFLFKMLLCISLLFFYPLILFCMIMDFLLPVKSGNGLLIVAKKPVSESVN